MMKYRSALPRFSSPVKLAKRRRAILKPKKNPRGVTLATLKAEAASLGMTARKSDGEFRVAFPGDEAGAYYTDDAADALGTMRDMYKRQRYGAGVAMAKNPRGNRSDSSVRSPTSTRSEVRSPTRTSTSTKADTRGNVTVTGGAGAGANTTVTLKRNPRRPFGKKGRKSAPRKAARVSGRYMIRGQVNGVYYFFNGRGFDSVGAHAAVYWSRGLAADASRAIKGMLPNKLKSLEVVPL